MSAIWFAVFLILAAVAGLGATLSLNAKQPAQSSLGNALFIVGAILLFLAAWINSAFGQEHRHKPEHAQLHSSIEWRGFNSPSDWPSIINAAPHGRWVNPRDLGRFL